MQAFDPESEWATFKPKGERPTYPYPIRIRRRTRAKWFVALLWVATLAVAAQFGEDPFSATLLVTSVIFILWQAVTRA